MRDLLKISNLQINNYKCFDFAEFDFESKDLIVFDGPNGYGKTTSFEAIEIIFAQEPRRIRDDNNINALYSYESSPIHNDASKPIEIQLGLKSLSEEIFIKRIFPPASNNKSRDNNIKQIFRNSTLYINGEEKKNSDLGELLQYPDLSNLFNVINYVEQDENTFFLKKSPKERYKGLVSLLGIENEIFQLEKIGKFKRKVSGLISSIEQEITNLETENKGLLDLEDEEIPFFKLFPNKDFVWDKEALSFTDIGTLNSFHLELNRLKYFFDNLSYLDKLIFKQKVHQFESDRFIDEIIRNYWGIKNFDLITQENDKREKIEDQIATYNSYLELIENHFYKELLEEDKHQITLSILKDENSQYLRLLEKVFDLKKNLTESAKIIEQLKRKREDFINFYLDHKENHSLNDSTCPTCGFDWETNSSLIEQIKSTEKLLFEAYIVSNEEFEKTKIELQREFFDKIKKYIEELKAKLLEEISKLISKESYQRIELSIINFKEQLDEFLNLLDRPGKDYIDKLLNLKVIEDIIRQKKSIQEFIKNTKPSDIPETLDENQIYDSYHYYFDASRESIDELIIDLIDGKRDYINYQYINSVNHKLQELKIQLENYKSLLGKTGEIQDKIQAEVKQYTSNIIKNISLPFYILTGKILQNHTLGSGLVFKLIADTSESQIRIQPIQIDQEASHTLSSGQLAATVISLMLVLNKVYNNSKLGVILIDDPLQTLDEINTHSLVEVLKHNFQGQQIIFSTHENNYSKFIRYKYEKFDLTHTNFRMSNYMNS